MRDPTDIYYKAKIVAKVLGQAKDSGQNFKQEFLSIQHTPTGLSIRYHERLVFYYDLENSKSQTYVRGWEDHLEMSYQSAIDKLVLRTRRASAGRRG